MKNLVRFFVNTCVIFIFSGIILFSCNNNHIDDAKEDIKKLLQLDLPNNIYIYNYHSSFSIGDYVEEYTIHFINYKDFQNFCNKVNFLDFNKEKNGIYTKIYYLNEYEFYFININTNNYEIYYSYVNL